MTGPPRSSVIRADLEKVSRANDESHKKIIVFFFSHSLLASDTVFSSIDRLKYSVLKILDWNNIFQSHKLVTKNQDRLTYRWYCSHILTVQSKAELAKTFM